MLRARHHGHWVTDLTEAADVSRKVLYLHFGDRGTLLMAAAVDLVECEVIPQTDSVGRDLRSPVLELAWHFAKHRTFYHAMLTGSCAFAMTTTLNRLFGSHNRRSCGNCSVSWTRAVGHRP